MEKRINPLDIDCAHMMRGYDVGLEKGLITDSVANPRFQFDVEIKSLTV